jgi:DNA-binding CsgD family transcriptional regulator
LLGTAEWLTGEPGSAADHLREATEGTTDPLLRAERAVALARAIFYTGQVPMAVEALERAAADTEGASGESIDRLEAEICSIGLLSPLTVDRALARIGASGIPEGNSVGELLKLTNHASREWMMGTADRTAEFGTAALAGDRLAASEGPDSVAVMQAVWVLGFADRQDRAVEATTPLVEQATKRGSIFGYTTWRGILGLVAITRGDMISAEAEARAALELSDVPAFSRVAVYAFLALALVERGALEEAEVAVTESGCGPFLPPMVQMNMAFYARGKLRLAQGRPEEALTDFQELGERNRLCRVAAPGFAFAWRCGAVEANRLLGDIESARRLAEDQLIEARRWDTPAAIGVAMHAAATVAEEDQTLPMLGEAVEFLADSPDRLGHARALVDLGAAMRRAGRRTQAREPLREGLEMARRCGATVLVERAHEELVTAGARPRRLMFSGLESLTAAERRVARRAADGRANREIAQELFVTTKTVENHLSRVYSKLDISGRDELTPALEGAEATE